MLLLLKLIVSRRKTLPGGASPRSTATSFCFLRRGNRQGATPDPEDEAIGDVAVMSLSSNILEQLQ
jgi:hypothetical protein